MITVLATGFGAFPGVRNNPSDALMRHLAARRGRFARLGIHLETHVLPVVYEGLAARLARLADETKPDAILHFGVAARRKIISVETRAHNRRRLSAADAQGERPASGIIDFNGPETIAVRIPAAQIVAKIRSAGIAAALSHDAGRYLCNATLYETLRKRGHLPAGFIHIPLPGRDRTGLDFGDMAAAAEIAIIAVAAYHRQTQSVMPASRCGT
jgi:pyroglutamyl-peptidase